MKSLTAERVARVLMNAERVVNEFGELLEKRACLGCTAPNAALLPYSKHVLRAAYKLLYVVALLGTDEGPGEQLRDEYLRISTFQPSFGPQVDKAAEERHRDMRLLETFASVTYDYAERSTPDGRVGLASVMKAIDALYPEVLEMLDSLHSTHPKDLDGIGSISDF